MKTHCLISRTFRGLFDPSWVCVFIPSPFFPSFQGNHLHGNLKTPELLAHLQDLLAQPWWPPGPSDGAWGGESWCWAWLGMWVYKPCTLAHLNLRAWLVLCTGLEAGGCGCPCASSGDGLRP